MEPWWNIGGTGVEQWWNRSQVELEERDWSWYGAVWGHGAGTVLGHFYVHCGTKLGKWWNKAEEQWCVNAWTKSATVMR